MTKSGPSADDGELKREEPDGIECDFCHDRVASVRRVALDGEYERLRTPHAVQYACEGCFERKDRDRLAGESGR
ncbi:MAG: hypothetical protein VCC04_14365 [Myxococcota bacterium]